MIIQAKLRLRSYERQLILVHMPVYTNHWNTEKSLTSMELTIDFDEAIAMTFIADS